MKETNFKLVIGFILGVAVTVIAALTWGAYSYYSYKDYNQESVQLGKDIEKSILKKDAAAVESGLVKFQKVAKMPYDANKLVIVYWNLGNIYYKSGQAGKAKDAFVKAVNISNDNADHVIPVVDAELRRDYSVFLDERGENMEAEKFSKQAYDGAVKAKNIELQIESLTDLAIIYSNIQNYDEADKANDKVMALYKKEAENANDGLAWTYNNTAYNAAKNKNSAKALEFGHHALEMAKNSKDGELKPAIMNTIGEGYYQSGDYQKAEEYFAHAIGGSSDPNNKSLVGGKYKDVARAQIKLGKFKEACANLQLSDQNFKFIDDEKDLNENKNLKAEANCQ